MPLRHMLVMTLVCLPMGVPVAFAQEAVPTGAHESSVPAQPVEQLTPGSEEDPNLGESSGSKTVQGPKLSTVDPQPENDGSLLELVTALSAAVAALAACAAAFLSLRQMRATRESTERLLGLDGFHREQDMWQAFNLAIVSGDEELQKIAADFHIKADSGTQARRLFLVFTLLNILEAIHFQEHVIKSKSPGSFERHLGPLRHELPLVRRILDADRGYRSAFVDDLRKALPGLSKPDQKSEAPTVGAESDSNG